MVAIVAVVVEESELSRIIVVIFLFSNDVPVVVEIDGTCAMSKGMMKCKPRS